MKRAAIYCRISQDREGAGLGVERQLKDCEALAGKLKWSIVARHTDNDMSAYSGKPRPGYRALLDDLSSGRADAVVVWHTDRLHRSPRELEEYVDLCEVRKIVTQTVKAGELDLATPSGRAMARTLGAWARFEVEHKSERTKRAQLQAAQAGRWLGGGRPFGWTLRGDGSAVLNRPEAREVRRAATRLLAGESIASIVNDLNSRGVRTSTGRTWSYATLRQVLTRARNAGLVTLHDEIVGKSPWPKLLTEDTWRAVCALLADPARRKSQSNRARWLLSGIALCGTCSTPLRSATATSTGPAGSRTIYRCPEKGVGHVARAAEPIDDMVREVIARRLSLPDVDRLLANPTTTVDIEGLRTEAVSLRMRLGEAADAFADSEISRAQLDRITRRVNDRLADVESALTTASTGSVLAGVVGSGDPARAWLRAPIDRQRAIVRTLLTVTVMPSGKRGKAFDPELIRIDWSTT